MREQNKHKDAFQYYLQLHSQPYIFNEEKIMKVAEMMHTTPRTIWSWHKNLDWRNRVDAILDEIGKKTEENIANNLVIRKAKDLADLDDTDEILQAMIREIVLSVVNGKTELKVKVEDSRSFAQVVGASEKVKKLKLLLLGEDTKRETIKIEMVKASDAINNRPITQSDNTIELKQLEED